MLELGCGTGRLADSLKLSGSQKSLYTGIDVSKEMLERARLKGHQVTYGNAEHLPFEDQSFDVVAGAKGVFRYLGGRLALKEASRVLRPGGTLVIHQYAQKTANIRRQRAVVNKNHIQGHEDYDTVAKEFGLIRTKVEKWRSISMPPYVVPIPMKSKGEWWSQINLFFQKL